MSDCVHGHRRGPEIGKDRAEGAPKVAAPLLGEHFLVSSHACRAA